MEIVGNKQFLFPVVLFIHLGKHEICIWKGLKKRKLWSLLNCIGIENKTNGNMSLQMVILITFSIMIIIHLANSVRKINKE